MSYNMQLPYSMEQCLSLRS